MAAREARSRHSHSTRSLSPAARLCAPIRRWNGERAERDGADRKDAGLSLSDPDPQDDPHVLPAEVALPVVRSMIEAGSIAPKQQFHLGSIVATPGALEALARAGEAYLPYIGRHLRGDWGDLAAEDAALNDAAIAHEGDSDRQGRVLSQYRTACGERIWIITESDRSASTILLPSEY
jgi:hypothetical protein